MTGRMLFGLIFCCLLSSCILLRKNEMLETTKQQCCENNHRLMDNNMSACLLYSNFKQDLNIFMVQLQTKHFAFLPTLLDEKYTKDSNCVISVMLYASQVFDTNYYKQRANYAIVEEHLQSWQNYKQNHPKDTMISMDYLLRRDSLTCMYNQWKLENLEDSIYCQSDSVYYVDYWATHINGYIPPNGNFIVARKIRKGAKHINQHNPSERIPFRLLHLKNNDIFWIGTDQWRATINCDTKENKAFLTLTKLKTRKIAFFSRKKMKALRKHPNKCYKKKSQIEKQLYQRPPSNRKGEYFFFRYNLERDTTPPMRANYKLGRHQVEGFVADAQFFKLLPSKDESYHQDSIKIIKNFKVFQHKVFKMRGHYYFTHIYQTTKNVYQVFPKQLYTYLYKQPDKFYYQSQCCGKYFHEVDYAQPND